MARLVGPIPVDVPAQAPLYLYHWPPAPHTLYVNGLPVRVDMRILAADSPLFLRMYLRNYAMNYLTGGRVGGRFRVDVSNRAAFIEMLRVIMPSRRPIDGRNVNSLLACADRFGITRLRRRCVEWQLERFAEFAPTYRKRCTDRCRNFDIAGNCVVCREPRIIPLTFYSAPSSRRRLVLCNNNCAVFDFHGFCRVCHLQSAWY